MDAQKTTPVIIFQEKEDERIFQQQQTDAASINSNQHKRFFSARVQTNTFQKQVSDSCFDDFRNVSYIGTARADGSAPFRHFQAKHPVNSALLLLFSSATLATKLGTFRSILSAKNSFIKDSGGSQNTHNSKNCVIFALAFRP